MSTLTALNPRPLIFTAPVVKIELVLAQPEDFQEFHRYGPGGIKEMKLRVGMIYWLKNMLSNQIESTPRKITKDEDQLQLKEWLDHDMIYVCKAWHV